MSEATKIAWTDATANFWMGCEKISPGCAHCYAETLTTNRMGLKVWGEGSRRTEVKGIWANLRKWNREAATSGQRKLVFVMSLGDFFEDHPDANAIRPRAWAAMAEARWLDYQILTKRPENIRRFLPPGFLDAPWPNVWLGTSIENDRHAYRADVLRAVPAVVRFISAEPLLGPLPSLRFDGLHWIIVGGESGSGYRPMDHAWARDLRDRAVAAGVAFFMKQSAAYRTEMGTYLEEVDGTRWTWKQYPTTPLRAGVFSAPSRVAA